MCNSSSEGNNCIIITHRLFEPEALYKGDARTRTIDVLVDGQKVVTWTSSGTTTDFETVELGVAGRTIELLGVVADSEWLSIMEVRSWLGAM